MHMAFDEARSQMVLFGGATQTTTDDATWLYATLGRSCATGADSIDGASCVDGVCCNVARCDACETCAGTSPGRCTPVLNTEDVDSCAARDGRSCDNLGVCKTGLGVPATNVDDCASGFLADGVCCDSACDGECEACRAELKESGARSGKCDVAKTGTDPHDTCVEDERTSCGQDGTCDGRGTCRSWAEGTACGAVACVDNRATGRICNGQGACNDSAQGVACDAYLCTESAGCKASCAGNDDCAALHHCEGNVCVADRGATCVGDRTVISPKGDRTECGLYRCVGAACLTPCRNRSDCLDDADCSPERTCIPFESRGGESGGCTLGARGESGRSGGWLVAAFLAAYVARRPRRRE